jgi:dTDP-glucose 4,6-dehydratase
MNNKTELIEKKYQNDPSHGIYHIVGEERNVLELANRISKIIRGRELNKSEIEFVDFHRTRPGHDLRYSLDGSKLKNLGFEYPLTLKQSFDKMIKWMIKPENQKWLNL